MRHTDERQNVLHVGVSDRFTMARPNVVFILPAQFITGFGRSLRESGFGRQEAKPFCIWRVVENKFDWLAECKMITRSVINDQRTPVLVSSTHLEATGSAFSSIQIVNVEALAEEDAVDVRSTVASWVRT